MIKNKKKRRVKKRNQILAAVANNDPTRYRQRTVRPEKGKGRKNRPRRKNWSDEGSFISGIRSCRNY